MGKHLGSTVINTTTNEIKVNTLELYNNTSDTPSITIRYDLENQEIIISEMQTNNETNLNITSLTIEEIKEKIKNYIESKNLTCDPLQSEEFYQIIQEQHSFGTSLTN